MGWHIHGLDFNQENLVFNRILMSKKTKKEDQIAFFVYGTLRPDASRQVHWCKWWNEPKNCTLKSWKGYVRNCDLFMGDYPFIILQKPSTDENTDEEGWKNHICFGYIQQFVPKISQKKYNSKLKRLDEVEGYPDFYQRKTVKAYYCPRGFDKSKLTGEEKSTDVHLYYLEEDVFGGRSKPINSGNFLKFKKKKKKKKGKK